MPYRCTKCCFVMDDQLCPYCQTEGRRLNSLYCPPCGIRIHQPKCPHCEAEGVYPMLNGHKKELFLDIMRGFQADSSVHEDAMRLLHLLHGAGIYNTHRESIEACVSVMEESQEIMPLIMYLAAEYRDNSAEWLTLRAHSKKLKTKRQHKKPTMLLQSITEAKIQCAALLAHNPFEWKNCAPDTIEIDALSPDFYAILTLAGEVFGGYRGDMRPPLHIFIDNTEKANVPFEPIRQLWEAIIKNEYSFGNYNFQLYAKGDENRCVNIGALVLS